MHAYRCGSFGLETFGSNGRLWDGWAYILVRKRPTLYCGMLRTQCPLPPPQTSLWRVATNWADPLAI
eukprot:scaffold232893_cov30-Tisochrysis_lutea.AAC.9